MRHGRRSKKSRRTRKTDKPQAPRPMGAKKNFQKYQQAQLNLQIVQELTISDYFALYLSQLKDHSMMLDAARKLSPDEIADLLAAYQKAISSVTSASNSDMALPLSTMPTPHAKAARLHD